MWCRQSRGNGAKTKVARSEVTTHGHSFDRLVNLCKTELLGRSGLPIAKQLKLTSSSWMFTEHLNRRFGLCDCPQHSCKNDVHWAKTATYTWKLFLHHHARLVICKGSLVGFHGRWWKLVGPHFDWLSEGIHWHPPCVDLWQKASSSFLWIPC